jgi:sugar O-acyltransferase (sialic acid O-acetyltransferase NeuD family)
MDGAVMTALVPRRVIIMGTGGFALELSALLMAAGGVVTGFTGPAPDCALPAPWLGDDQVLADADPESAVLVAAGNPGLRQDLLRTAEGLGRRIASFVHPAAWVAPSASLGAGSLIYPNSTLHAAVRLGQGVLINSNVTIGHETEIGAFTNLGPGCSLGGRTRLGERVIVGIGATIIERLEICDDAVIGAGAAVIRPLSRPGRWVGVPARLLEQNP